MFHIDAEQNRQERERTLTAAAADLRQSAWCLGAVVCGSIAADHADAWADIDLRAVVDPAAYDRVLAERYDIPHRWGQVLFDEGVPHGNLAIVHFKPFFKLDIFYYRPADLRPSPYWLLPQMILHDPHGIVAGIVERSGVVPVDAPMPSLWYLKTRAVAAAEEVRRKILRCNPVFALDYLQELRGYIAHIHQRQAGGDLRLTPIKYLEYAAPAELRQPLLDSCQGSSHHDLEAALQTMGRLLMTMLDDADGDLRCALANLLGTGRLS